MRGCPVRKQAFIGSVHIVPRERVHQSAALVCNARVYLLVLQMRIGPGPAPRIVPLVRVVSALIVILWQ